MKLRKDGYDLICTSISESTLGQLQESAFSAREAGKRCLLDKPVVRDVVVMLREDLVAANLLPSTAVAIQSIAFDKTPAVNWKVAWHQDVMFPFARPVTNPGFDLTCKKDGVDYARPPLEVLEDLLVVRLHVDKCDDSNGPLKVSPGSHLHGVIDSTETRDHVARHGEMFCIAERGEALLMKPLLLHASSKAREPKHRRVLHVVFHSGRPMPESWYRTV